MRRHLPNLLSVLRLALVPVTIWLITRQQMGAAFVVFVVAGLTDALDGFLAKRLNAASQLGAYLDPLADKALLIGVYVTLSIGGYLPLWLVLLIVLRDLLIVGGALAVRAFKHALELQPLLIGKINTALQIVLAAFVLGAAAFGVSSPFITQALVYLTAATTVGSAAAYIFIWTKRLRGEGRRG